MRITEFNRKITAQALNENAAKMFGQKLNLDSFTLEQLEDARNKLRTRVHQVENAAGFSAVYENDGYSKNKMFLDILNRAIEERTEVVEFTDMERMVLEKVEQGVLSFEDLPEELQNKVSFNKDKEEAAIQVESVLREGEEEKAELIMAARDMVDRVTGWMEDTANMQAESMLELVDSIRDEMGTDTSMEFESVVKPALATIYTALESSRQQLTQGVAILTGEFSGGQEMMGEPPAEELPAEEPAEELPPEEGEEAGAAAPAAGGEEPAGRAVRETAEFSRKLASLLAPKKK